MWILSHNSFFPQATWEGPADPKPLCFWHVCSVPGGALVGSAAGTLWDQSRSKVPGLSTGDLWQILAALTEQVHQEISKTLLIWPNLTFIWGRGVYISNSSLYCYCQNAVLKYKWSRMHQIHENFFLVKLLSTLILWSTWSCAEI